MNGFSDVELRRLELSTFLRLTGIRRNRDTAGTQALSSSFSVNSVGHRHLNDIGDAALKARIPNVRIPGWTQLLPWLAIPVDRDGLAGRGTHLQPVFHATEIVGHVPIGRLAAGRVFAATHFAINGAAIIIATHV